MNFVTKKKLDRRTFLRNTGACISLPFLDAMVPAFGSWDSAERTRLICIEEVHGQAGCNKWGEEQHLFAPSTTGSDYELLPDNAIKSLEKWRDRFTIISNTDVRMAEAFRPTETGGDHFRSSAVFLTQSHPKQTQGSDISCGISLDQLHAQRFGQSNMLPSLQLGIEPTDIGGGCGYNYSCSYTDSLSWASPTQPLPMIRNPRTAFDMLFGAGGSEKERARRRKMQASILDWIVADVTKIKKDLGALDRRQVDDYLENVREIERRIQLIENSNSDGQLHQLPGAPAGIPDSFSEHMKLMFDLQILAFQSDKTRVVSFKTGRDGSSRIFNESGSGKPFHPASHHGGSAEGVMEFNKICAYRVSQLNYFLERLSSINDAGASLLDQSLIIWGSPMGDPNLHNHRRCPLMIMGEGNGRHQGGAHIKAPDGTPMANVMLAILNRLGHDLESFGDSTGELSF